MKFLMAFATTLMIAFTASAYQYQTSAGVHFKPNGENKVYKCWVLKVWNVSASDLRKHSDQISSKLVQECRDNASYARNRCAPKHGNLACKTQNNCTRTFRACFEDRSRR